MSQGLMRETLCLIAGSKNEAKALPAFFEHHAWADEILVMDSFSTDNTTQVCEQYGRRCHHAELAGNANIRLNLAATLCRSDWMFVLDPDEFISDALKQEILGILSNPAAYSHAAYEFPRINYFMDTPLMHGGWSSNALKLFRKGAVEFQGAAYHEHPQVRGTVGRLKGAVHHYPNPNIHWIVEKFNYISEFDAQAYYEKYGVVSARSFKRLIVTKPLKNFWKAYVKKQGYKDGLTGFVYAMLIWALDVVRICKYGERFLLKNPHRHPSERLPDPWECRK